jgi:hypothetical protein
MEKVFQQYRLAYGDGAYRYARRTISQWQPGQVRHVGQAVMRLLEIVPVFVDRDTKFELVRILREETLRRLLQTKIQMSLTPEDSLDDLMERIREIINAQVSIQLPPGYLQMQAWLTAGDAEFFQRMIQATEAQLLNALAKDFLARIRNLQEIRREIEIPVRIEAVFELPTASITLRIVNHPSNMMSNDKISQDDHTLLARWNALELESRFKSGDVSYPEYVLRNMDQYFTEAEQAELNKIAAMHGLELERQLMEIQIKSRTSEADLHKLLTTLRTLQEKGISADVLSRHETPSGHIEISARNRKKLFGCLPWFAAIPLGIFVLICLFLIL